MPKSRPTELLVSDKPKLTLREVEVAIYIAEGKSYPEIGDALGLGYETVRSHVDRLRDKTGRRRKVQLAVWASDQNKWLIRIQIALQKGTKK